MVTVITVIREKKGLFCHFSGCLVNVQIVCFSSETLELHKGKALGSESVFGTELRHCLGTYSEN